MQDAINDVFIAKHDCSDFSDEHFVDVGSDDQSAVEWWDLVGSAFHKGTPRKWGRA